MGVVKVSMTASRVGRSIVTTIVVVGALVAPLAISWLGLSALYAHELSLSPDGDLDAGGRFGINLLWLWMICLNYLGSFLVGLAVFAWLGDRGLWLFALLGSVIATSGVITLVIVALNWG